MVWDKPILTDSGGFQVFFACGNFVRLKKKVCTLTLTLMAKNLYGSGGKYADSVQSGFYDCNGI